MVELRHIYVVLFVIVSGSFILFAGVKTSHFEKNNTATVQDYSHPESPKVAPTLSVTRTYSNSGYFGTRTVRGLFITGATVPVTGSYVPRIYYKNSGTNSAWASAAGTLVAGTASDGEWSFTITYSAVGGVSAGQQISYYFVAQSDDGSVTCLPAAGASHTDVLTRVTAPTTPYNYIVRPAMTKTTIKVGGTGADYPRLTGTGGLFDSLSKQVVQNDFTVIIGANLDESASSIFFSPGTLTTEDFAAYKMKITTDGTARVISSTATTRAPIIIDGPRITIDGGASKLLTLRSTAYFPVRISNTASQDTIRNCIIEGATTTAALGAVTFYTNTNPPDNIVIENCDIKNYSTSALSRGIYVAGGDNITIKNNNIYNFNSEGISLANAKPETVTITGNSFYRTTVVTTALTGILSTGTVDFIPNITNNYFGGQAAQCGGTALNMSTFGFTGINVISGNVQGNKIANFTHATNTTGTFTGIITAAGAGASVNIGSTTGNLVGDTAVASSITNVKNFIGISTAASPASAVIEKNIVSNTGLLTAGVFTGFTGSIIKKNRIFSITPTASTAATITGIKAVDDSVKEISNNMIALTNATGGTADIRGILCAKHSSASNAFNVYHNSVLITGASTNSKKYAMEITYSAGSNYASVFNNVFANRIATASASFPSGIYLFGNASGIATDYNLVYSTTSAYYASLNGGTSSISFDTYKNGYFYNSSLPVEGNSRLQDAVFLSATNLRQVPDTGYISNILSGIGLAQVTTDIDGAPRKNPPVAGCHETSFTRSLTSSGTLPANGSIGGITLNLNSGTALLSGNTILTGPLTMNSGTLSLGNYTLTLNQGISYTGGTISVSSGSNIVLSNPSATDTVTLPPISGQMGKLKISQPSGVKLSSNIVLNDSLNLEQGILVLGNNTLELKGPVVQSSGSFKGGTGAGLKLSGTAPVTLPDITGGLKSLVKSGSGSCVLSADLTVHDTLSVTAGFSLGTKKLSFAGKSLSAPSGITGGSNAEIEITGTGADTIALPKVSGGLKKFSISRPLSTIRLTDSLSLTDTLSLGNGNLELNSKPLILEGAIKSAGGKIIGGSGSALHLNGDPADTTVLPAVQGGLAKMVVNRSKGAKLTSDITISDTLKIEAGKLATAQNKIVLSAGAQLVGETTGRYVVGAVMAERPAGFGASDFGGIGLSLGSGTDDLGNVTVTRNAGPAAKTMVGGSSGINRNWRIEAQAQPSSGRTITFNWVKDDDSTSVSVNAWSSADSGRTWQLHSGPYSPGNGNIRSATVQTNHFSDWTFSSTDNPLPVELSAFEGSFNEGVVSLKWQTASEVNNEGFEIQRAHILPGSESRVWEKAGYLKGKGNSSSPQKYSFTDRINSAGMYAYRLKQEDAGGTFKFSQELQINAALPREFALLQNYPNPFNPNTTIEYFLPVTTNVKITIYNITGSAIKELINSRQSAGYYSLPFGGAGLSSGIYYYRIEAEGYAATKKMTLLK